MLNKTSTCEPKRAAEFNQRLSGQELALDPSRPVAALTACYPLCIVQQHGMCRRLVLTQQVDAMQLQGRARAEGGAEGWGATQ